MTAEARSGPAIKILLVDDRRENLLALEAMLDGFGYTLVKACSGEEALRAVLQDDFAAVLMDVSMPGMDGFETATMIKRRPRCETIPILFITASICDAEHLHRGYSVGAVDYLYKPVAPEVVRAKVAVFAELYRQRQHIAWQAGQLHDSAQRERATLIEQGAAALRVSEAQYEAMAQGASVGIAIIDAEGAWVRTNPSLHAMLGYEARPLPSLRALMAAGQGAGEASGMDGIMCREAPTYRGEVRLVHCRGSDVWTSVAASKLTSEPDSRLALVLEDISARKRGERTARLLSHTSEILLSALDYRATVPQVAQLMLTGMGDWCAVDVAHPDGRRLQEVVCVHRRPERLEAAQALRRQLMWEGARAGEAGEPCLVAQVTQAWLLDHGVLEVPAPGGAAPQELHALLRVPMVAHGRVVGAITLASESPLRTFDGVDLQVMGDLAHRCAFAIENTRLYEEAQQAVRARDEFLSVASHELRTPLTPLRIQLQRLIGSRHRPPANLPKDRVHDILQRSERHVQRLGALIDNLLDVSRITSGRLVLELDEVDLAELTRDVAGRFSEELSNSGSRLALDAATPTLGRWDRSRLDQVVTNLLTNAIKYGSGRPIEMCVHASDGVACLSVRDNGIGIAADKQEQIFRRFERAVSARSYGGLGLGLFIARQILDAHGGSIQVASQPGEGAMFTVELPVRSGAQGAAPAGHDASALVD